jgi:hypothetical protein
LVFQGYGGGYMDREDVSLSFVKVSNAGNNKI